MFLTHSIFLFAFKVLLLKKYRFLQMNQCNMQNITFIQRGSLICLGLLRKNIYLNLLTNI